VQANQGDERTVARLVDSVLRPLTEALRDVSSAHGVPFAPLTSSAPSSPSMSPTSSTLSASSVFSVSDVVLAPGVPLAEAPASLWDVALDVTRLRAQSGRDAPPGLLEAAAALQDLACRQAPTAEWVTRIAALEDLQRNLPPAIMTARNGPYLVTNVPAVRMPLGDRLTAPPQLALCRCGDSAMKPFCDATCASNGFTDAKDPNRVRDRRDTYPGQQLTIFDNRGICQHSGFCTDRSPTAFRADQEPFVAPSGARMDELVRAVRDCPSGALSLAFDGDDDSGARSLADWHGRREAARPARNRPCSNGRAGCPR
jgi:uncharacterized Fe-S cluster protein YjdI